MSRPIGKRLDEIRTLDKINILMVDDQPSKLLSYEAILSELGENLFQAGSANEALDCLLRNDVAVVLTDVDMPGLDGFELAKMIHGHPRFEDVAILFVSAARMTDADRLAGYDHGAVDYISVPIVPELLRAKVRVFSRLHRKTRELKSLYGEMGRLSNRMIAAQDDERRRIARELHDSLGQQLAFAKMAADRINVSEAREQAAEVAALIEEALRQVRSISHLLHPPMLDEIGLEYVIGWYLEGLTKRSGIETAFEVEPRPFPRLPQEMEIALYRILQEAVTNAYRHSAGRRIWVRLQLAGEQIRLAVRDDGKGVSREVSALRVGAVGVGLGGMRQRVAELGGQLRLAIAEPGTLVEVVIPSNPAHCD
jgi:signal transduction histidine kinase